MGRLLSFQRADSRPRSPWPFVGLRTLSTYPQICLASDQQQCQRTHSSAVAPTTAWRHNLEDSRGTCTPQGRCGKEAFGFIGSTDGFLTLSSPCGEEHTDASQWLTLMRVSLHWTPRASDCTAHARSGGAWLRLRGRGWRERVGLGPSAERSGQGSCAEWPWDKLGRTVLLLFKGDIS